jgi:hypothetical protein
MTLAEIFVLIIGHFIADFVLQDVDWANNKSTSNKALLKHTVMYSLFWCFPLLLFWRDYPDKILWFLPITFILHTVTDYITSRIVKKKFEKKEYGTHIPNRGGFTVIGLDQVLHYLQLFITYKLLTA